MCAERRNASVAVSGGSSSVVELVRRSSAGRSSADRSSGRRRPGVGRRDRAAGSGVVDVGLVAVAARRRSRPAVGSSGSVVRRWSCRISSSMRVGVPRRRGHGDAGVAQGLGGVGAQRVERAQHLGDVGDRGLHRDAEDAHRRLEVADHRLLPLVHPGQLAPALLGHLAGDLLGQLGADPAAVLLDLGLGAGPDGVRGRAGLRVMSSASVRARETTPSARCRASVADPLGLGAALPQQLVGDLLGLLDDRVRVGDGGLAGRAGLGQQRLHLAPRAEARAQLVRARAAARGVVRLHAVPPGFCADSPQADVPETPPRCLTAPVEGTRGQDIPCLGERLRWPAGCRGPARCDGVPGVAEAEWPRRYSGGCSEVESAAMNASWGTSTRPTIFIRFLPSFCFSSSLRLRVMSPP